MHTPYALNISLHNQINYIMLFWILGAILVLSSDVLVQGYLDCSSSDQVLQALRTCNHNRPANPTTFITNNVLHGYEIISTMTSVCRNTPTLLTCVANITATCPQISFTLNNAAERYHRRLCTGIELSDWFLDAMKDTTELDANCVIMAIQGIVGACPTIRESSQPRNVSLPTWYAWTESYMTELFSCLRENLSDTLTCDARAQDAMIVFYTYVTVMSEVSQSGPTDAEFALFKELLRPVSRRDWIHIAGGRR